MIEKQGIFWSLQCDYCSNSIEDLESFNEAVDYKKENGWASVKDGDYWIDKCPNCVGGKEE